MRISSHFFIIELLVAASVSVAVPLQAQPTPSQAQAPAAPAIRLVPVVSGLRNPVALTDDGSGRLFVVEQRGRIRLIENGQAAAQPLLDLTNRVYQRSVERGVKALAFHPAFATNGRFFVNYVREVDGRREIVFSEFRATGAGFTNSNPDSEKVLLSFEWLLTFHGGGNLVFGPDGMLYLGTGDAGNPNDTYNQGQQLNTYRAKILRIDVDHPEAGRAYGIPRDNPFVGREGAMGEIWAYGMRNPWGLSFDRETKQFYVADVGENRWEEVNIIERGGNYGWSAREGAHDHRPERANGSMIDPIKEYGRQDAAGNFLGNSITGGYVYRGRAIPALQGSYVYGDYTSGRIWALRWNGRAVTFDAELLDTSLAISAFGEDRNGEIYVLGYNDGTIHRIVAAEN